MQQREMKITLNILIPDDPEIPWTDDRKRAIVSGVIAAAGGWVESEGGEIFGADITTTYVRAKDGR